MTGRNILFAGAIALGIVVSSCLVVVAEEIVNETFGIPASVTAKVTADGCENNPGPYITLEGTLTLGALKARLIFRNNEKGTHEHTEDVVVEVTILNGQEIKFAKQPPEGGVGGNPWIYMQLLNHEEEPISDAVLLGRCVQGLDVAAFGFKHFTDLFMTIAADCSNNPGPYITLGGEVGFEGIKVKLIFQNSRKNPQHVHEEIVAVSVTILDPADGIKFAKQPPLGGVGGNPRIYVQFVDGNGYPLCKEIFLGKCVQLSK